jgi:copper chaperone
MAENALSPVHDDEVLERDGVEVTLKIEGMHCGSCIRRVTQAIHQAGPFAVKEVRLGAARFVAPAEAAGAAEAAVGALAKAGFTARVDG